MAIIYTASQIIVRAFLFGQGMQVQKKLAKQPVFIGNVRANIMLGMCSLSSSL